MKTVFSFLSWSGVAALMTQPDPQFWVTLGVLITSAASVYAQRQTSQRIQRQHEWEEKQREWDREDREAYRQALATDIAHNTQITKAAAEKADAAYEAANHVNEKIARLAQTAKVSDVTVKRIEEKTIDTNDTAHRIEDKL
jgi:hypothetical protein